MGSRISITQADVSVRIGNKKPIYRWIEKVVKTEKRLPGELSIILCSDEFLLQMNNQFLKHNYFTDIITFDYSDGKRVSGELFISTDRVKENAKIFDVKFNDELHRVIIHGILHLCGYGDKTLKQKEIMRSKEDQKLKLRDI